jgi:pimeloyl-ACP methyl ester carboxylesterase
MPFEIGIHYRYHRDGASQSEHPPLVLIHGAGGSHLHWPPEMRRMSGETVYSLDLPGHGQSVGDSEESIVGYARRLLEWLDALTLGEVVLVGHSMGGAISLTVSLEAPHRVRGLVLVGSGAKLRVHPHILALTDDDRSYQQATELVTQWAFSANADARMTELAQKRMAEVPAAVVHADFVACDNFDLMKRLGDVSMPTLVLCGTEDQLTPVKYSQFLAAHIPHSRLETVEGAGHMVMLEKPIEIARYIGEFVHELK